MAIAFKSVLDSASPQTPNSDSAILLILISFKRFTPMASPSTSSSTLGLADTFTKLKKQGKVAFIPYITAGDPDLSTTAQALKVLDAYGSDIMELGVLYSDPLADGPVIQAAATRSLERGTNLDNILEILEKDQGETEQGGNHRQNVGEVIVFHEPAEFHEARRGKPVS